MAKRYTQRAVMAEIRLRVEEAFYNTFILKKSCDLVRPHFLRVPFFMKENKAANKINVSIFSPVAGMPGPRAET